MGRRAINVSGGAAPLRRPYEHDLLYIESTHIDEVRLHHKQNGRTRSAIVWHWHGRNFAILRRNPYCFTYSFAAQEENAEHNNDRRQLTDNNDNDYDYYNNYNSRCAVRCQCDDAR